MRGGRWLFFRFRVDNSDSATVPLQFQLVREALVFAPRLADEGISARAFASSVVITQEVSDE